MHHAVADFSLLLTKGYADKSALKLVGDRFSLTQRQRLAVMRSACSDQQLALRKEHSIDPVAIRNQAIAVDGYNVLITIEAALSGGLIFKGRDSCYRDLASIHSTYRRVTETIPAVELIGDSLRQLGTREATWYLDSPVSNSGRVKKIIEEIAEQNNWPWQVKLSQSPDAELVRTDLVVASSDSAILDRCKVWVNLAAEIIKTKLPEAKIIDLSV